MPVSPSLFSMTPHAPDGLSEWPTRRPAVIVPFVCSLGAPPFRVNTEQCDPLLCEKLRAKSGISKKNVPATRVSSLLLTRSTEQTVNWLLTSARGLHVVRGPRGAGSLLQRVACPGSVWEQSGGAAVAVSWDAGASGWGQQLA